MREEDKEENTTGPHGSVSEGGERGGREGKDADVSLAKI